MGWAGVIWVRSGWRWEPGAGGTGPGEHTREPGLVATDPVAPMFFSTPCARVSLRDLGRFAVRMAGLAEEVVSNATSVDSVCGKESLSVGAERQA